LVQKWQPDGEAFFIRKKIAAFPSSITDEDKSESLCEQKNNKTSLLF